MPKMQLWIDDEAVAELDRRAETTNRGVQRSEPTQAALDRYFAALADARASLRSKLTGEELTLIADTLNGRAFAEPGHVRSLWMSVEDNCRLNGADARFDVDGAALVANLQSLSLIETMALVDAAERFWLREGVEPARILE